MIQELQKLLKPMDLPDYRKSGTTPVNLKWLAKNLEARNKSHKNYQPAMEILNKLVN